MTQAHDREATMIQPFALTMNVARHPTLEHHPQIEQEEGDAREQEAQGRGGGRGAGTHAAHWAISGFSGLITHYSLMHIGGG